MEISDSNQKHIRSLGKWTQSTHKKGEKNTHTHNTNFRIDSEGQQTSYSGFRMCIIYSQSHCVVLMEALSTVARLQQLAQ